MDLVSSQTLSGLLFFPPVHHLCFFFLSSSNLVSTACHFHNSVPLPYGTLLFPILFCCSYLEKIPLWMNLVLLYLLLYKLMITFLKRVFHTAWHFHSIFLSSSIPHHKNHSNSLLLSTNFCPPHCPSHPILKPYLAFYSREKVRYHMGTLSFYCKIYSLVFALTHFSSLLDAWRRCSPYLRLSPALVLGIPYFHDLYALLYLSLSCIFIFRQFNTFH